MTLERRRRLVVIVTEKHDILLGSPKEAKGKGKDKVQDLLEGRRVPSRLTYQIEVEIYLGWKFGFS